MTSTTTVIAQVYLPEFSHTNQCFTVTAGRFPRNGSERAMDTLTVYLERENLHNGYRGV